MYKKFIFPVNNCIHIFNFWFHLFVIYELSLFSLLIKPQNHFKLLVLSGAMMLVTIIYIFLLTVLVAVFNCLLFFFQCSKLAVV